MTRLEYHKAKLVADAQKVIQKVKGMKRLRVGGRGGEKKKVCALRYANFDIHIKDIGFSVWMYSCLNMRNQPDGCLIRMVNNMVNLKEKCQSSPAELLVLCTT